MTEKADVPVLIVQEGQQAGQRWPLNKEVLTIGRGSDCDILLNDKTVSRHHARIAKEGDKWMLHDESKNGTHVNGQDLAGPHHLKDGDVVVIATATKLVFVGSEATVPLAFEMPKGGRLKLDVPSRRVWVKGKEIDPPLSLPQYRLLELLYARNGQVCSREEVVLTVWPDVQSDGVSEQSIDALIRRLRDRIAEFDLEYQFIVTVRGQGFRLDNPEA